MLRRAIICLYSSTRVSPRLQVIRFHPLLWKFCVVCLHEASVFQLTAAKFGWWLNRGRKTGHSRDNILIDYGLNIIWYYVIIIRDHGHDFESWQSRGLVFKFMHYANITSNCWFKFWTPKLQFKAKLVENFHSHKATWESSWILDIIDCLDLTKVSQLGLRSRDLERFISKNFRKFSHPSTYGPYQANDALPFSKIFTQFFTQKVFCMF